MKRLLCIVGSMNKGGAETFLMKIYRKLNRSKYQMDFCVSGDKTGVYADEIQKLGGKIFKTVRKTKNLIKSYVVMKNIVKKNHFEFVMRLSQHSLSAIELIAAKRGGAKKTIYRISNTKTGGGFASEALHRIFRPFANMVSDIKIAPSTEAARFAFGNRSVRLGKVLILPNALDIDAFRFNPESRNDCRQKLGIEDRLVVGHIGRLSHQKNHKFLIKVFSQIKKRKPNAVLLVIGQGELESEIKSQVKKSGLEDAVRFLGLRDDIPELLWAMDGFVFPSFYEGMPNTIIEAQTAGLPCLISDSITPEVGMTSLVCFKSLNDSASSWADKFLYWIKNTETDRKVFAEQMRLRGYDIESCARTFEKVVFSD